MRTSDPKLDRTLVQGIAWTGGMKWLTQLVSWAVTLVVARLLTPADYGLFGMAMVYLGLAQLASEAGLLPVVVQPKVLDDGLASRIGGLALMTGVAVFAMSAGFASVVAWFFNEERVRMLVVALSFTFVLRGAQVLPRGLLARDLDFRRLSWIDGVESMIAALATVTGALLGLSYWALVLGSLCGIGASTVMCFAMRPHRITFPRDVTSIAGSLSLGGHVVLSQFAWYAYSNADFAVVGRLLGRASLGTYSLAWTIANVPVDRVTSLVQRVTAPIFAAVQNDRAQLRRYVYSLTEGLALVTLPLCVGLALVSGVLVRVMLVPAWEGVIVPLRLLSMYAAFRCVTSLLAQVLIFTGNAKRNMQLSVLAALVLPVSFYIAATWGTTGVAAVWVTVYPGIVGVLYVRDTMRVAGMSLGEYLRAMVPAVSATLAMTAAVAPLNVALAGRTPPGVLLAVLVATGAAVYTTIVFALHGRRMRAVIEILRGRAPIVPAPSYAIEPAAGAPTDRLLLVSWHFPPDSAVGGLRWQKFARHAAERGWGLDVIMRDPRGLAGCDPERTRDLPAGTRVYFVPDRQPYLERFAEATVRRLRSVFGSSRGSHATPANGGSSSRATRGSYARGEIGWPRNVRELARAYFSTVEHRRGVLWARDVAALAGRLAEMEAYRAVVSSGPPHFVHSAASAIARDVNVPFIMDLRDPWSEVQRIPEWLASPVTLKLAAIDEARAIESAALVVMNTAPARDAMARKYPCVARKIVAIPNGYDEDPLPASRSSNRFAVVYAGTIYLDRDPRPLFRAAAQLITERGLTPPEFGIELMGDVAELDGVPIATMAAEEGVHEFVRLHEPRPRAAAMEFLASATMLVLLPQDSDFAIPAKLFEYMRADAWLMVLATPESATARLLEGIEVDIVEPEDVGAIRHVLETRVEQHLRGERPRCLAQYPHLSRRARANELIGALEAIVGTPTSRVVPRSPSCSGYDQTSEPASVFAVAAAGTADVADVNDPTSATSASSARHAARVVMSSPMIMPITK